MAVAVAGSDAELRRKPFLLNYSEPISPLRFIAESVQKLLFCAEKGIPVTYAPSPNMGGGGPVTMAGAIALANAETLAGLLLAQLTNPGTPYLYGANVSVLDMRQAVVCYGSPEWPLSMAALTDLARSYGLPAWGYSGATDSKEVDAQAGLEAMLSTCTAFQCRSCLNHDVGYLEFGSTSSMEMITLVDEIISMLKYIDSGVEVNDDTLALESIEHVQPGAGFLADKHTSKHWRKALFLPTLLDRQRFDVWEKAGKPSIQQRLNKKVKSILAEHEPQPLSDAVESEIAAILKERLHG
jgi:trimethylamine--corrinoid protein Co-methyltransferase